MFSEELYANIKQNIRKNGLAFYDRMKGMQRLGTYNISMCIIYLRYKRYVFKDIETFDRFVMENTDNETNLERFIKAMFTKFNWDYVAYKKKTANMSVTDGFKKCIEKQLYKSLNEDYMKTYRNYEKILAEVLALIDERIEDVKKMRGNDAKIFAFDFEDLASHSRLDTSKKVLKKRNKIDAKSDNSHIKYWPTYKENLVGIIKEHIMKYGWDADLNDISIEYVDDLSDLFYEGSVSRFRGSVSKWDVRHIKNMRNMFKNCHLFKDDLSNWKINQECDVTGMLCGCEKMEDEICEMDLTREMAAKVREDAE